MGLPSSGVAELTQESFFLSKQQSARGAKKKKLSPQENLARSQKKQSKTSHRLSKNTLALTCKTMTSTSNSSRPMKAWKATQQASRSQQQLSARCKMFPSGKTSR